MADVRRTVATATSRKRKAADLDIDDLPTLTKERKRIVEAASQREAPSMGAKRAALQDFQSTSRLDAVYNYRPLALAPCPIIIYSSAFTRFISDMAVNSDGVSFSHDELDNALTIVTASSMYYDSETNRMEALCTAFGNVVSPGFLEPRTLRYHDKEAEPDGSVYCSHRSTHNIVIAVVEGKNETGEGDIDPLSQAECVYVALYTSPEVSVCPCFGVVR